MKTREEFKRLAFGAISQKFPDLSNENIALADNKLDELYDNELAKEAVTIPEGLGVSDYLKPVKKEASEFAESGKEMLGNIPGNIIPTAKGLAQGVAGFGVDVASGLAQLPTGLISPQAAEEIKYTGKGIKQLIGAEPEQPEYNTIQEAREARELRKKIEQYGEENPTWFSNFKKTIKEQPGSEELMSSAEGLKNFFQKGLTNVADVASIAATGEPIYDEQLAERIIKEPVQVGIETALPLAGMSALLKKGKQATTRYAPIEKPKETFIEELPPTKEIVQGMGEPARNVLAETEYNNLKEQANTLAAKTEVRMLEEQMKENASRAARQAELEQTLAPISVYDMLIREAEKKAQNEADMLSNISPITAEELAQTAPTLSIRDILQRGQAERGLKQPEIIDEQTGRIIKPTTTPEEMLANPLLRYENFPEFGIETIDYKKSAENILSKATEQPLLLTNGQNIATILPSVKEKGKFQFTAFDERGPIRDITKNNKQELIEEALHDGYENLATQEQFENLTKKTSFLDFMKTKKNIEEKIQPEINVKEGFNKYLETLDTKNKARITNQIKPKINELQYLANNNERIEIIYDKSGKENYRISNGNLQTKINKTEYNILKQAGMKTIEPEQPLISKDWENMSTDELRQYPISELEKVVSDKRIQFNKRVALNLKLQELKALDKFSKQFSPEENDKASNVGAVLSQQINTQKLFKDKFDYAQNSGLKNGNAFIKSLIKGDYPQVIADIEAGRTNLNDVETAINKLSEIDISSKNNNDYYLEKIKNQLQPQQEPLVEPEQPNIPLEQQPAAEELKNAIKKETPIDTLNNFITNEEGFINPAKLFDFLFKPKGEIDNPIETDPNLKKYNQDMQAGYEAGEQKLIERNVKAEKLKPDWWTKIITEVVKKEYPITSLQNKIEKRGVNFSDEKNIKLLADAFTYLPTKIQGYLYTVEPKVLGINPDTMGKIMQMQRIVTERKDIANRYTPVEAEQYLNYIKENMPNEWVKYESAMNQIQKNRQEFIIPELKASRLFPEQLINKIENNLNYSTNQVVKYIDSQRTGNRMTGATAQILQQIGSGEEISNPYKTTILKDISLLQAAKLNSLKLAGVDFLLEYFPEMIQKAKPKFLGESKYKVPGRPGEIKTKPIIQYEEPKESALSTLWLRRDGKSEAYYIRKDIVDALNMKSDQPNAIAKNINNINNIFKNTWIRYNYKFWLPAFAKDIIDTFIFMPTYKGKKEYFKQIIPAIGKAVKSVFGADPMSDPQIREYYKAAIFNPEKRSAAWSMAEVEPFERTLKSYDINLDKEAPKSFLQSMTSPLKNITNKYSELGSILERANKFAVDEALKNVKIKGKILTPEEINFYSRRLGSPAFLASGKQTKNLQALFPFINPVVQGLDAAYSLGKLDPIGVASSLTALSMLSAYGVAAGLGYLGKEKEEEYKNLTDNEKNNFFNVLGSNIKIPIGFMYKPIHKLMTSFAKNDPLAFKDFFVASWGSTILDELPTFSPVVNLGFDVSAILEGQRIYDYYRGYHPIERTAEQAQTTDTALEYLKYFFNKYGGGSYYRMGEEEQNYAPWQRFVRTQKEKESGEKQRLYGAVNKADILYARSKLASMQKAKGEEYDKTQKILPKEYIKTKKAERIENLKLPLKTKAMMKILNEPDFYKKSLLIKQFKKEGLLNE